MQYSRGSNGCQPTTRFRVDELCARFSALLWKPSCVLCKAAATHMDLCDGCAAELPRNECCCVACADPLPHVPGGARLCGACMRRFPAHERCFAPFLYSYPLDSMIRAFKYAGDLACGRVLALQFSARARECALPKPQLIVPVPLATRRYRERGFNQATELALPIAAALGVPIALDLLVRARETRAQASLGRRRRAMNLRSAFFAARQCPAVDVAILDDVMTTGATMREAARALLAAGATSVHAWAIARAAARGAP